MTPESDLPIPSVGPYQQTAAFAGPPPLIAGERSAGYDELLARVSETLQPSDVLEHIWIRDIVDLVWEVYRLRRLKANLMSAAAHEGMTQLLGSLLSNVEPAALARAWAARREDAVSKVEATLAAAGLTMDHVAAATLSVRIGDFERIERMTAYAEGRRNSALHELDLHRASFALRLRRALEAVQGVEDAEFEAIPPAAALASEGSGQRGHSIVRAPDTRPEPGSSAREEAA